MLNGYITYNELKLITGYDDTLLKNIIMQGLTSHELTCQSSRGKEITQNIYNLDEVVKWISLHIF